MTEPLLRARPKLRTVSNQPRPAIMTSPHDPCGKIYTILSEEWTAFLWFFEPVFIPQAFRDHLVLVLGWTAGRRGYVSISPLKAPCQFSIFSRSSPTSPREPTQITTFESRPRVVDLLPTRLRSRCERTKDLQRWWNYRISGSTGCGRSHLRSCWWFRERGCS